MSLGAELLDELCYAQAELPISTGCEARAVPLTVCALTANGSERTLQFGRPYFVRHMGPSELGPAWQTFCSLLRRQGIPLFGRVATLQDIPAAAVPVLCCERFLDQPLDALEVAAADALELACYDLPRRNWGWSSELHTTQLGDFVSAVRQAAGSDTPIGIGLPLGSHLEDIRRAVNAQADFISLNSRFAQLEAADVSGLVQARQLTQELNQADLPILVSAPLTNVEHVHKLLALGASAVSIDGLLRPLIPALAAMSTSAGAGMLSGLAPVASRKPPELPAVAAALVEFQQRLEERLRCVGASDLKSFTSGVLRSCSPQAELITGVTHLRSAGK